MAPRDRHACLDGRRCIGGAHAAEAEHQAYVNGPIGSGVSAADPPAGPVVGGQEGGVTSLRETSVAAYGARASEAGSSLRRLVETASHAAVPVAGLLAGAVFAALQLNHGWVPWDDGTLAQSAQRVLAR